MSETDNSIRCVVEKEGLRYEVWAQRTLFDRKTDELAFPSWLYERDGFTLIAMQGEPDFESLSDQARLDLIRRKLDYVPKTDPETSIYYVYYKEDVAWLLDKLNELKDEK